MHHSDTLEGLLSLYRNGGISRRTFLQRAGALGLGLPMAALLAGGSGAAAAPAAGGRSSLSRFQDGGVTLNVAHVEEPDTLDPHNLTAAAAGLIGYVVMPGLVWWDYDLGVSPQIAESWETSEDGLTWTFHLRSNLVFHNGKPCTAQEVARNFEHIIDPEGGSFLQPDFASVDSVAAPDDTTVVFTLKEAFSPFLAILTNRVAITDMDDYNNTTPVGTGPFKIVEWQRGTGVMLEAHDGYWEEGLPLASRVNWRFMPTSETRVLAIQGGEVDIISEVPSQQITQLQSSGNVVVEPIAGVTHQYLAFNCAEGPFADVRARKAVAHAIDKEVILEAALWGFGTVTNIPFPASSPWFVDIPDYEYDPERAKALLEEAGLGDGISIDMPIANWSPSSTVAEIVQGDLAAVGINLRIVETEWATYWPEIYLKTDFYFTFMGYSARVDPDQTFYPRYHTNGIHNATRYSNARMDELLEQGRRVSDLAERQAIYAEVQEILVDELPWIWLYLPDVMMGWAPNVTGFRQHPGYHFYVTETTKEG